MESDDTSKINFVFCRPFKEPYYSYGINSVADLHLKKRGDLEDFLVKMNPRLVQDFIWSITHFETFIFDNESGTIIKTKQLDLTDEFIEALLKKDLYHTEEKKESIAEVHDKHCQSIFDKIRNGSFITQSFKSLK